MHRWIYQWIIWCWDCIFGKKNNVGWYMSEWHGKLTYISVKFVKFLIKSKEELTLYISLIRLHIYTNIMKLVLLREIEITIIWKIYSQTFQWGQVRKTRYWTFKRVSLNSPTKTFNSCIIVAILLCFGGMHRNLEMTKIYHPCKIHLKMKPETLMAYSCISFVQFPMKSGILPVKGLSDAQLKPKHIYCKLCSW